MQLLLELETYIARYQSQTKGCFFWIIECKGVENCVGCEHKKRRVTKTKI